MDKLLRVASMNSELVELPSKELLDSISMESSYGRSMNKLKVTESLIASVVADIVSYESIMQDSSVCGNFNFRVKTQDSILRKVERYPDKHAQQVFNDVLGLRMIVDEYPTSYPDYLRVVDMSNGKTNDDGYRGVHLYYKKDNYSYIIEIQLWSKKDRVFNTWMHMKGYKSVNSDILRMLKAEYGNGLLETFEEYSRRLDWYCERNKNLCSY